MFRVLTMHDSDQAGNSLKKKKEGWMDGWLYKKKTTEPANRNL